MNVRKLCNLAIGLAALGLVVAMPAPGWTLAQASTPLSPAAGVSLEAVAAALDAGDLDRLGVLASDPGLSQQLAATDPDTLIELRLAVARAFAEAGRTRDAVAAYNQALLDIVRFRGQGDVSLAEPMEELAALASDPGRRADWLGRAFEIRETVWGRGNPNLRPYLIELNGVRILAGLTPIETRSGDFPTNLREAPAQPLPPPPPASPPPVSPPPVTSAPPPTWTPPPPPPSSPPPPPAQPASPRFDLVNVYYATHRAATGREPAAEAYGSARAAMSFGVAQVSVPRDRAPGSVPRPSIWTFEFRPDPERHMILNSVSPISTRDGFFARVSEAVSDTSRKEVFVFIHGYNTSFEGAAIRTAQLAVDMNLDGAAVLYSWPSRASLLGYQADTRTVADPALLNDVADFLTDVANRTGAERVHLVAHSMGNRVLGRSLDLLAARSPGRSPMFHEVVMAAADVGVDEFEQTWPRIMGLGRRFTLYASQRDRALQISEQVNRMRRVGDARDIVIRSGLQTVDTTAASGGLLGHDDFAGGALADFRAVMWLSLDPEKRCVLDQESVLAGRYWTFGGRCAEADFTADTSLVRTTGSIDKALAALDDDMSKAAATAREGLLAKRRRLVDMFGLAGAPAN